MTSIGDANPTSGVAAFTYKTVGKGAATAIWAAVVAPAEMVGGTFQASPAAAQP